MSGHTSALGLRNQSGHLQFWQPGSQILKRQKLFHPAYSMILHQRSVDRLFQSLCSYQQIIPRILVLMCLVLMILLSCYLYAAILLVPLSIPPPIWDSAILKSPLEASPSLSGSISISSNCPFESPALALSIWFDPERTSKYCPTFVLAKVPSLSLYQSNIPAGSTVTSPTR